MQEDIAGIGQHQGRHGKYATFYAKREMSEDFRDTPLVRTPVSRNRPRRCCIISLHHGKILWLRENAIHARSNTEIPSQVEQKDAISACQKKRPVPMLGYAPRGETMNPAAASIVAAARTKPAEM